MVTDYQISILMKQINRSKTFTTAAVRVGHGESHFILCSRFQEQHAAGEQVTCSVWPVSLICHLVMNTQHWQGVVPKLLTFLPERNGD